MNLLEFHDVKKNFKKKEVLSNISFKIGSGEIYGLIGKSGSGKSTLLNILIGMVGINGGSILFEGKEAMKKINELRRNTGFATQENMLFDELTIRENCFYFGDLYGMKKKDIQTRFTELITFLDLNGFEDTFISNLSGGMIKRANLLVSLIHNPKLLILDEPTVGLDPIVRNLLWRYIHKINSEGTTILVTSHLLEEIEQNCHRVGIIKQGKIYSEGTLAEYKKFFGLNSLNEIFQVIMEK